MYSPSPALRQHPPGFTPYEQRLMVRTRLPIACSPEDVLSRIVAPTGAKIVRSRYRIGSWSWILSLSSLFLFPNEMVLICCAENGLAESISASLQLLSAQDPIEVVWDVRRAPSQKALLLPELPLRLPVMLSWSDNGLFGRYMWRHSEAAVSTAPTLLLSLHGTVFPDRVAGLAPILEELLGCGESLEHTFGEGGIGGYSLNVVGGAESGHYATLHVSGREYASVEVRCANREGIEQLFHSLVLSTQPRSYSIASL